MIETQADGAIKTISCDEYKKMIPKGTALIIEAWEKVLCFCGMSYLEEWKKKPAQASKSSLRRRLTL